MLGSALRNSDAPHGGRVHSGRRVRPTLSHVGRTRGTAETCVNWTLVSPVSPVSPFLKIREDNRWGAQNRLRQ